MTRNFPYQRPKNMGSASEVSLEPQELQTQTHKGSFLRKNKTHRKKTKQNKTSLPELNFNFLVAKISLEIGERQLTEVLFRRNRRSKISSSRENCYCHFLLILIVQEGREEGV